jgi:protein-tyrosine phosphatase
VTVEGWWAAPDVGRASSRAAGGYTYLLDGRLAQGSAPPADVPLPFETVVLAAKEYQPLMPHCFEVLRAWLDDSGPPPTPAERTQIHATAHEVARRVRSGRRVLVTCMQGRNRSGVIAGLALAELGMPRGDAVRLIRALRNGLTNPYFLAMVEGEQAGWGF